MECSTPRFLQSQNSSIGVIIRDSFGKTVAAMNKISLRPTQQKPRRPLRCSRGGSCLLLKWKSPMLSLDQTPSPSSNPWTQAKTAAKSGISSRTSEQQSFPSVGVCSSTYKRDDNRAAHELAREARLSGLSNVWKGVTPPQIQHVLLNDSVVIQFLSWNEYPSCFTIKKKNKINK